MKMLHLRGPNSRFPVGSLFAKKLQEVGEFHDIPLDPNMSESDLVDFIGQYDAIITMWGQHPIPPALAGKPGKLKYVCNVTGTLKHWVPAELIEAGIQVTNWGDAPANGVAEGAMALLLASLKDIPSFVLSTRAGVNGMGDCVGGTLYKTRVAIYGLGVIGIRFVEMIRPFGARLTVYDPYVDVLPEGCKRVNSLDELCKGADILVVHAGRSAETDYSITARHLAMLPDHGIIVNTARGEIFKQDELFESLKDGRLRAGIDVFDADVFEEDHPARQWPNLIYTSHCVSGGPAAKWPPLKEGELERMYEIALENLTRFKNGEPLKFTMDLVRYNRST